MSLQAKYLIYLIASARETGKTDLLLNSAKTFLKGNPGKRVLFTDVEDSPPLRDFSTWDDPNNMTPIPIIKAEEIKHWGRGSRLDDFRAVRTAHWDINKSVEEASKHFYNGMLIMEDATKYVRGGKLSKDQEQAIYGSKQHGLHLMFAFHLLRKIPEDLASNANVLILGKTGEKFDKRIEDRFPFIGEALKTIHKSPDRFIKEAFNVGV